MLQHRYRLFTLWIWFRVIRKGLVVSNVSVFCCYEKFIGNLSKMVSCFTFSFFMGWVFGFLTAHLYNMIFLGGFSKVNFVYTFQYRPCKRTKLNMIRKASLKETNNIQPMLIIIIVWLIRYLCLCNQSTGTFGIIFGIYLQYFSGITKFIAFLVEDKEIPSGVEKWIEEINYLFDSLYCRLQTRKKFTIWFVSIYFYVCSTTIPDLLVNNCANCDLYK